MNNQTIRSISRAEFERIDNLIKDLKKMSKQVLMAEYRQTSRLDLGSLKDLTKDDLVYALLNAKVGKYKLMAYDANMIVGEAP